MLSEEQLEAYCNEYYVSVYKYCLKCLGNKEDAEDTTQSTFVIFKENYQKIKGDEYVKPWLFAVAKHLIFRVYAARRKQLDRECVFDEVMLESSMRCSSFEDAIVDVYGEEFEREIYESMSPREKELYDLYTDDLIKPGEKARILGISGHASSMKGRRFIEWYRDKLKEKLFY